MLPWPRDTGKEAAPEQANSDQAEACSSNEEAQREPEKPPQDSLQLMADSTAGVRRRRQLLPRHPSSLIPELSPGSPVLFSPQVPSSGMPLFSPWDPSYGAKARPQQASGNGPGPSFSGRTLCHPSFWPIYEAWGRGHRYQAPILEHQNRQQAPRDAEFPVMYPEDVFFLDPLLPPGQRVPLYLSQVPRQVIKLQLPAPIMSPSVHPSQPRSYCLTQLSWPELIAVTGLLQMSQGEARPGFLATPPNHAGPVEPISDPQSSSESTDPFLPRASDTHCP